MPQAVRIGPQGSGTPARIVFDTIPGVKCHLVDLSVQGIEHPAESESPRKAGCRTPSVVGITIAATRFLFSQGRAPSFPATREFAQQQDKGVGPMGSLSIWALAGGGGDRVAAVRIAAKSPS